jgi:protein SCO1/2
VRLVQSRALWTFILTLSWLWGGVSVGDSRQPRMGIFTKPDARIDLSREFADSDGNRGALSSLLTPNRPFILVPVFYRCPRLCGLTVSGVVDLINSSRLKLGEDYSVIFYSFNPEDTRRDAAEKRERMIARISRNPTSPSAVQFLTADPKTISLINDELGFRVRYADKELEHSSAIFIATAKGRVIRYFAGVEFRTDAVTAALVSAQGG